MLKLGKLAPRFDARTLRFGDYGKKLPPPPATTDWTTTAGRIGMMLNDQYGDCVVAGFAHTVQVWTGADAGRPVIIPDADILANYMQQTGGDDTGLVMLDSCKWWRKKGLSGHKIDAFVSLDHRAKDHFRSAIHLFGNAYVGVSLYQNDMGAFDKGKPWANRPRGESIGGHCIPIVGYSRTNLFCITWGRVQPMTWAWAMSHIDEAYCLFGSLDWAGADKKAPNGFDVSALRSDLALL